MKWLFFVHALLVMECHGMLPSASSHTEIEESGGDPTRGNPEKIKQLHIALENHKKSTNSDFVSFDILHAEVILLLAEEDALAEFVNRWEWLPDFPLRFAAWQALRDSLCSHMTHSGRRFKLAPLSHETIKETPQLSAEVNEALTAKSVGAYYFAHFLTSNEALSVFTYDFGHLLENQRTELYAEMHRHCAEKHSRVHVPFRHMEVKVCNGIEELENLLQQMQDSPLSTLLAQRNELPKNEPLVEVPTSSRFPPLVAKPHGGIARFRQGCGSWSGLACRSSIDCFQPSTVSSIQSTAKKSLEDQAKETKLLQAIASENYLISQVLQAHFTLASRFGDAFTVEHDAIVKKAMEWKKQSDPIENMVMSNDANGRLPQLLRSERSSLFDRS